MFPSSFEESNHVLEKPPEMSHDQCDPLSVYSGPNIDGQPVVVSYWKCTPGELAEIIRTGRVWLVVYGRTMPPVSLCGAKPFEEIEG